MSGQDGRDPPSPRSEGDGWLPDGGTAARACLPRTGRSTCPHDVQVEKLAHDWQADWQNKGTDLRNSLSSGIIAVTEFLSA